MLTTRRGPVAIPKRRWLTPQRRAVSAHAADVDPPQDGGRDGWM